MNAEQLFSSTIAGGFALVSLAKLGGLEPRGIHILPLALIIGGAAAHNQPAINLEIAGIGFLMGGNIANLFVKRPRPPSDDLPKFGQ